MRTWKDTTETALKAGNYCFDYDSNGDLLVMQKKDRMVKFVETIEKMKKNCNISIEYQVEDVGVFKMLRIKNNADFKTKDITTMCDGCKTHACDGERLGFENLKARSRWYR